MDTTYKKLIRESDGRIGILYTASGSRGWSTGCRSKEKFILEKLIFDKRLVEAVHQGFCELLTYDYLAEIFNISDEDAKHIFVITDVRHLRVMWVHPTTRFQIQEARA